MTQMARKFYTLDDLYNFCKENRFESFSADKQGAPLIVQSFGTFEADEKNSDGLMAVRLKSCHTGKNRNQSGITDDNMNKYKHTFKGRPILGAIYKTDTGEYEFRAHDMEIIDDGEDIKYIEQPIGVISQIEEPYLEYDAEEDKNYLMVSGTIFSDYSKAAEILERRRTCKCSVEIAVEELSYNCDEDYLSIDKFRFSGVTILGYEQDGVTEIQEGMKGSKITIDDFSEKKNSMFSADCQNKLVEILEKLNTTLESFNNKNQNSEKGGEKVMNKFEELCSKYNKTADEVTFEYENLSDEELEVAFKEAFEEVEEETETVEETVVEEEAEDAEEVEEAVVEEVAEEVVEEAAEATEDVVAELVEEVVELPEENFVLKYELSHDDVRSALYSLLSVESDDHYYTWILEVYDDKFIYQDYMENKFYRRGYSKDGENVSLDENKVEVFNEWLSKAEKDALDALKSDYAVLKEFKSNYDESVIKAQKNEVLDKAEYECLAENKEFAQLRADMDNYSIEEISTKADLIFAAHMKSTMEFGAKNEGKKADVLAFNFNKKESKKGPYGNLFNKD
jgi:chemotaxis protein histidine kinase CheA